MNEDPLEDIKRILIKESSYALAGDEFKKAEVKYKNGKDDQSKFHYGVALVSTGSPENLASGIQILKGTMLYYRPTMSLYTTNAALVAYGSIQRTNALDDEKADLNLGRACLYYITFGFFRQKNYALAIEYGNKILRETPHNMQVRALVELCEELKSNPKLLSKLMKKNKMSKKEMKELSRSKEKPDGEDEKSKKGKKEKVESKKEKDSQKKVKESNQKKEKDAVKEKEVKPSSKRIAKPDKKPLKVSRREHEFDGIAASPRRSSSSKKLASPRRESKSNRKADKESKKKEKEEIEKSKKEEEQKKKEDKEREKEEKEREKEREREEKEKEKERKKEEQKFQKLVKNKKIKGKKRGGSDDVWVDALAAEIGEDEDVLSEEKIEPVLWKMVDAEQIATKDGVGDNKEEKDSSVVLAKMGVVTSGLTPEEAEAQAVIEKEKEAQKAMSKKEKKMAKKKQKELDKEKLKEKEKEKDKGKTKGKIKITKKQDAVDETKKEDTKTVLPQSQAPPPPPPPPPSTSPPPAQNKVESSVIPIDEESTTEVSQEERTQLDVESVSDTVEVDESEQKEIPTNSDDETGDFKQDEELEMLRSGLDDLESRVAALLGGNWETGEDLGFADDIEEPVDINRNVGYIDDVSDPRVDLSLLAEYEEEVQSFDPLRHVVNDVVDSSMDYLGTPESDIDVEIQLELEREREREKERPYVVVRRYNKRGGKKIKLPGNIDELLVMASMLLDVSGVRVREVATEAELEDINSIEPNSILWIMTEEDEQDFC